MSEHDVEILPDPEIFLFVVLCAVKPAKNCKLKIVETPSSEKKKKKKKKSLGGGDEADVTLETTMETGT